MDTAIIGLLALIAAETTYLSYKTIPKAKIAEQSMLIDTSVLIDGRILPIARSYLITAPLIIPRSVVRELQYMADKADHEKRERAREGLDMIEQLQRLDGVTVTVVDDKGNESGVDERLVELAQTYNARLCTVDYNLNKSARAQGVNVVNINELAHALRIIHLPGETISLKLVQPGQESRQAVGYLDDGTMVVVDDAKALIQHDVEAEITRVLQTSAGKMMFAKLVSRTRGEGRMIASDKERTRGEGRMIASDKERTRGEGRMIASDKERTRGEANGSRNRLQTSSKQHARVEAKAEMRDKDYISVPSGGANDRSQVSADTDSQAHIATDADVINGERQENPKKIQSNNPRAKNVRTGEKKTLPRRRRTPEDALVDLANND